LDYNDVTITDSYVNIATNYFTKSGNGAALVRLPKVRMSNCKSLRFNWLHRSDNFTFKLVPGSTSILYFGSNMFGRARMNGSWFRMFWWPENSTSYRSVTRRVARYKFFSRDSGQNCASRDGVVKNWCAYADSRVLGAYRANGVIGFSFNAKQDAAHPFPYTRLVRFRESDKSYLSSGDLWSRGVAIQFLSLSPNSAGRVGGVFAWGGGRGRAHYYPGAATYSTGSRTVTTVANFFLRGGGNPCRSHGLYRWGDYLTVRTFKANRSHWIGGVYAMKGGNCGSTTAYAEPHNVLFR
jgi:hypothetical protein